jgi:hypothetical protein
MAHHHGGPKLENTIAWRQVDKLARLYASGVSSKVICRRYGISHGSFKRALLAYWGPDRVRSMAHSSRTVRAARRQARQTPPPFRYARTLADPGFDIEQLRSRPAVLDAADAMFEVLCCLAAKINVY